MYVIILCRITSASEAQVPSFHSNINLLYIYLTTSSSYRSISADVFAVSASTQNINENRVHERMVLGSGSEAIRTISTRSSLPSDYNQL